MANTARMSGAGFLSVLLTMTWLVSLAWAQAMKNGEECAHPRAHRAPSYESFFGRQTPLEAESPKWRIDLVQNGPGPLCLHKFLFKVRNKRNSAVSEFSLCNETVQADELDIINDTKALLLGRVGANFPVASVVDLASGRVEDHFACYLPALSPDHRFLAFVKSFPGHPGPAEITAEYIVYDLTRDADYNRPHFKQGVTYDAGWPLYPAAATNAAGENTLAPGSPYHSWTSRELFWLDGETLTFTDFFQGQDSLVVANLRLGVRHPEVRTLDLDTSQLVDLDQCRKSSAPSDFKEWSREPAGLIRVGQIDPVPGRPTMACLYFVSSPCLRYASLMVQLP